MTQDSRHLTWVPIPAVSTQWICVMPEMPPLHVQLHKGPKQILLIWKNLFVVSLWFCHILLSFFQPITNQRERKIIHRGRRINVFVHQYQDLFQYRRETQCAKNFFQKSWINFPLSSINLFPPWTARYGENISYSGFLCQKNMGHAIQTARSHQRNSRKIWISYFSRRGAEQHVHSYIEGKANPSPPLKSTH